MVADCTEIPDMGDTIRRVVEAHGKSAKVADDTMMIYALINGPDQHIIKHSMKDIVSALLIACSMNGVDYGVARLVAIESGISCHETVTTHKKTLSSVGVIKPERTQNGKRGRPRLSLRFDKERFLDVYRIGDFK